MTGRIINCATQADLDAAVANGDTALVTTGSYQASGSASVRAYDSASVRAFDSARVRAFDSARVEAFDSASVRAFDSARVRAFGSASVRASDSARVEAGSFVPVQDHGPNVHVVGGVHIPIRPAADAQEWLDIYGVPVVDGVAILYKAVGDDWRGSHKTDVTYEPGSTPVAADWDGGKAECGGGLHFSPRPWMAVEFNHAATRFVACPVAVDDIAVHQNPRYPSKVKARGCCAPVFECDQDGNPIAAATGAVA